MLFAVKSLRRMDFFTVTVIVSREFKGPIFGKRLYRQHFLVIRFSQLVATGHEPYICFGACAAIKAAPSAIVLSTKGKNSGGSAIGANRARSRMIKPYPIVAVAYR